MRIGILGGTFDPIHEGHLALARAAYKQLTLNHLIFVPSALPPLKDISHITPAKHRLEMVKIAIRSEPHFAVSDCEIKRGGVSYTVDTLRFFRSQYKDSDELFFVTGGDWGQGLDRWKEIDVIFQLAQLIVAKRPGYESLNLPPEVKLLDFVPLAVSATEIRKRLASQNKVDVAHLPQRILDYIRQHQLYLK